MKNDLRILHWLLMSVACGAAVVAAEEPPATLDEVLAAKQDLWGMAARRQPNGASYEYFAERLPPCVNVNAQFLNYAIVLAAPAGRRKPGWFPTAAPSMPGPAEHVA